MAASVVSIFQGFFKEISFRLAAKEFSIRIILEAFFERFLFGRWERKKRILWVDLLGTGVLFWAQV